MKKAPVLMPTLLSIGAHAALVALMFLNVDFSDKPKPLKSSASYVEPQIVETVSVNSKQVDELVKKIRKKKKREKDKQKALERRLAQLEAKRKKEEKRSKNALSKRKKEEALAKAAAEKRKKENKLAAKAEADRKSKEIEADMAAQKLAEEQQRVADAKKKRELEELNRIRQEELERQMLEEQNALSEERQRFVLTESEKYQALIRDRIYTNLVSGVDARVKIKLAPGGLVIDVSCVEGDAIACKAAQIAIEKSEPLPMSKDPDVFAELRNIDLKLNKKIPGGL